MSLPNPLLSPSTQYRLKYLSLFGYDLIPGRSASRQEERQEGKANEKNEEKEGVKAQRAKPPTTTRAIDAFIEEEDQKQKQKKKKDIGKGAPNTATMDHSVASYDPYGSYGGPILKPQPV